MLLLACEHADAFRVAVTNHDELERDGSSVPVRVILASVIIALAFPALILSLSLS